MDPTTGPLSKARSSPLRNGRDQETRNHLTQAARTGHLEASAAAQPSGYVNHQLNRSGKELLFLWFIKPLQVNEPLFTT